jgi:hypothetical protein
MQSTYQGDFSGPRAVASPSAVRLQVASPGMQINDVEVDEALAVALHNEVGFGAMRAKKRHA